MREKTAKAAFNMDNFERKRQEMEKILQCIIIEDAGKPSEFNLRLNPDIL